MTSRAFVFPGQGSQAVGMGRELAAAFASAREVFDEVNGALKQNLSRLMFEGPEDELTLTENAQPALMAVSLAAMRVLQKEGGLDLAASARFVAGHSLGEYSALTAAGTFSVASAAKLLKIRGRAMQDAVPAGKGAMAALLGLELKVVKAIAEKSCQGAEVCAAANDNSPGQVVISGSKEAVERAVELAGTMGAKRCVMLPVSAPFHCPLMKPAALAMAEALNAAVMSAPSVELVANVTAEAVSDVGVIRRLLAEQVTEMVRWRESVVYMKDHGVTTLIEVGAGKVLSGLTKRIDRELSAMSIGAPDGIEEFLKTL